MRWSSLTAILVMALGLGPATAQTDNPAKECRRLLKQAIEQIESQDHSSALELLGQVLECDPDNGDAYYYRAVAHVHEGDSTSAVSDLVSGLERSPRSWRLNLFLARLRIASGDTGSAKALLDNLFLIKADHGEALYLQGLIHLASGDSTKALAVWQAVLKDQLMDYPEAGP